MTVEEIPSDKLIEMNETFHRIFNAAGCNPKCHNCHSFIPVGNQFKLSTIPVVPSVWGWGLEDGIKLLKGLVKSIIWAGKQVRQTKEVMLCDKCTPQMFVDRHEEIMLKEIADRDAPGGCFRVNGKIVTDVSELH